MKTYTMIARHGSVKKVTAFTIISSDYQTITVNTNELIEKVKNKSIVVNNLELGNNGLVSTNGAMDRYTLVSDETMQIIGKPRGVILDRVEQDGKLVGYTAFTHLGTLKELSVLDAVNLVKNDLICNGKIRHTENGDIVSSINGHYNLRQIELKKVPKGQINFDMMYFGTFYKSNVYYAGVIVSGTSATEMSKINEIVSKSNKEVLDKVKEAGGDIEPLKIQRIGTNSVFGVITIQTLIKLIATYKENSKFRAQVGDIKVSVIDSEDEAFAEIKDDWKFVKHSSEKENLNKVLNIFLDNIEREFKSIKITR